MFSIQEEDNIQTTTGEHQQATIITSREPVNKIPAEKNVRARRQTTSHRQQHNNEQTRDFLPGSYNMSGQHARPPSFVAAKNLEPKLYKEDVQNEYKVLEKMNYPYATTKRARSAVQSAAFWQQLGPTYETEVEDTTPPRVRRYDKPVVVTAACTGDTDTAGSTSSKQQDGESSSYPSSREQSAGIAATAAGTMDAPRNRNRNLETIVTTDHHRPVIVSPTATCTSPTDVDANAAVDADADESYYYYESPMPRMPDTGGNGNGSNNNGDTSPYARVVDMLSLARLDETFGIGNMCIQMCSDANLVDDDDDYDDAVQQVEDSKRRFEA